MTTWDPDGVGPSPAVVVAGGNFEHVGAVSLSFVGLWDGAAWRSLGAGLNGTVVSAAVFHADGPKLPTSVVLGGHFEQGGSRGIARFDGLNWHPFGSGVGPASMGPRIFCIAEFAGNLVIGGLFLTAGGVPVGGLARWDRAWHALPDERAASAETLVARNGVLYAGGNFFGPGGSAPRTGILRWNDPVWENIGPNPPDDDVLAITFYRGELIAGGRFTNIPSRIARFDGVSWQPLGAGLNGVVRALAIFDPDGPGPMPDLLIAGGSFSMAGGQPASGVAAWDGQQWMQLGAGTSSTVRALTIWNNQLVVAGDFFSAGGIVSPGMTFWGCPLQLPCYPNCDVSTTAPILNIGDFICFLNSFSAASPAANCDNSSTPPTLNVSDFICFLNKFAAGCP